MKWVNTERGKKKKQKISPSAFAEKTKRARKSKTWQLVMINTERDRIIQKERGLALCCYMWNMVMKPIRVGGLTRHLDRVLNI
jgi:hypothetical protein